MHKTGDIGKMLGDAGIVYTPNGKKYIVVMLVNRPYNSPEGKDFIVKASSIVYNYMFNRFFSDSLLRNENNKIVGYLNKNVAYNKKGDVIGKIVAEDKRILIKQNAH